MNLDNKYIAAVLGYGCVLIIAFLYHLTPLSDYLDNRALDIQYQILSDQEKTSDTDVVVIGINAKSFEVFEEPLVLWHRHLEKFVNAIIGAGPAVVGIDFILPVKSYDFMLPGTDEKFLRGVDTLKSNVPFVFAQTKAEDGSIRKIFPPILSRLKEDNLGLASLLSDADGVVRHIQAEQIIGQARLSTLNASLLSQIGIAPKSGMIDYARARSWSYQPIQKIIEMYETGDIDKLELLFKDKVVLLGSVLHFIDRHKVPVALALWEPDNLSVPGVLIQAQALQSQMDGTLIKSVSMIARVLVILLFSGLWWLGVKPSRVIPVMIIAIVLYLVGNTVSLWHGMYMPASTVVIMALIATLGRIGLESVYAWREKYRLKDSFGRYVSPQVLEDIVEGKIMPGMGGKRYQVCVLFSDIRSFTKRSEGQDPKDIIGLLNRYFNEMTKAVHEHGGTVDKFIGDGLMAFFGAPMAQDNPAANAFAAAKEMLIRLHTLNEQLEKEGVDPIAIGVGLHVGEVIVGHVGSDDRYEYTAIGDTVNVASRLEGVTKLVGYPVVCSQEVRQAIAEDIFDDCGEQMIKGHTPVTVYGWKPV